MLGKVRPKIGSHLVKLVFGSVNYIGINFMKPQKSIFDKNVYLTKTFFFTYFATLWKDFIFQLRVPFLRAGHNEKLSVAM